MQTDSQDEDSDLNDYINSKEKEDSLISTEESDKKEAKKREKFREQMGSMIDKAPSYTQVVIGGDMNAEVGAARDREHAGVLGPHGDTHRTETGQDMIDFCTGEELCIAQSYTQQGAPWTWWHMRWGTPHQLDHFITKQIDRWSWTSCKTLHYHAGGGTAPDQRSDGILAWGNYTDHDPVEIAWRTAKNWAAERTVKEAREKGTP